jgi:hypothetical protein
LVACGLSAWATQHLGEPVLSRVRGDKLLLTTADGLLALLNATDGRIVWRRQFPDITAFDYAHAMVAASDPRYLYLIDGETGLVVNTTRHNLTHITAVAPSELAIAALGDSELQLYSNGTVLWARSVTGGDEGIDISENGVNCGGNAYNIETGDQTGPSSATTKSKTLEFKWVPTVLEAFDSGRLLWRIDQPLYNSTLLGFAPNSNLFVKNATHFFLFDFFHERIIFIRQGELFSFAPQTHRFILDTPEGLFLLFATNGTCVPYEGDFHPMVQSNVTVKGSEKLFAFPLGAVPKCTAVSQAGAAIAVADEDGRLLVAVLNYTGRLSSISYVEDAIVGTCWSYDDSLSVSYYKPARNTSYVASWSAPNKSHKTYTTERLVLAATTDHFVLSNGKVLGVEGVTFHGALQTTATEGHYTYRPDVTGYLTEVAIENARVVVDAFSSLIVQGYDVNVLEGGMNWTWVYVHLGAIGVMVCGAIFMGIYTWWENARRFWS